MVEKAMGKTQKIIRNGTAKGTATHNKSIKKAFQKIAAKRHIQGLLRPPPELVKTRRAGGVEGGRVQYFLINKYYYILIIKY